MIPYWKLKRELKRPFDQLRAAVLYPIDAFQKWRHDRSFHRNIRITTGAQDAGPKFAILLIYQPKGLAKTTFLTCQHLAECGYSVLLVSNTRLSEDARAQLAPKVWRILERPNVGYDFGGYRDGLRVLQEANVDPQALMMVNDSIWWPLCSGDTAVQQMEQRGVDVAGMILRPMGKPRKRATKSGPHLQSYVFWFGPNTLKLDAFTAFWRDYSLSSFKYNAIRHGELRLTLVLAEAGMRVAPIFTFDALMERLQGQPDAYLRKVLHYGAYRDAELAGRAKKLETAAVVDEDWRDAVFEIFREMDRRSEFHLALRYPCVDLLGLNFLKRSAAEPKDSMHHVGRGNYLEAIRCGDVPAPMPEVLREIEERHQRGAAAVGR